MKTEDKAIQLLIDMVLEHDNNLLVCRVARMCPSMYTRAVKIIKEEQKLKGKYT